MNKKADKTTSFSSRLTIILALSGFAVMAVSVLFLEYDLPVGICTITGLFLFMASSKTACKKKQFIFIPILLWLAISLRYLLILSAIPLAIAIIAVAFMPYAFVVGMSMLADNVLVRHGHKICAVFVMPVAYTLICLCMTLINLGYFGNLTASFTCIPVFVQNISWLSEFGMTFVVMLILSLAATAFTCGSFENCIKWILSGAAVAAALFISGAALASSVKNPDYTLNVAVALSQEEEFFSLEEDDEYYPMEEELDMFRKAVEEAAGAGADLLVLNEEYCVIYEDEYDTMLEEISSIVRENRLPVLFCFEIPYSEDVIGTNAAVFLDADGVPVNTYTKNNLVPIVETGNYVVGDENPECITVTLGGHELNLSYAICFDINDDIFMHRIPDNIELLIVPSWDWDMCNVEQKRTFVRSLELNTTLLKHTYDGFTYVSGPWGLTDDMLDTRGIYEEIRMVEVPIWEK